ncbi:MAG: hypothetical protein AB1721_03245, partial [Patescibacteria group bacterium]
MVKTSILTEQESAEFLKKEKLGLGLILFFCLIPLFIWGSFIVRAFYLSLEVQETKVVIKENSGFLEVSRTLKENGIISNSNIFNLYLIASGKF